MSLDNPDYTANVIRYNEGLGRRRPPGPLLQPPGDGGSDNMEARVKALETHIEYVRSDLQAIKLDVRELRTIHDRDFRQSFGYLVVATLGLASLILGLAGLMAKGFKWF